MHALLLGDQKNSKNSLMRILKRKAFKLTEKQMVFGAEYRIDRSF